jgi:hypothetical protein
MITSNNYIHPVTTEQIPEKDIKRARRLIKLYTTKLGMFKNLDESTLSPEFKLKNRLNKLFSKYHIHNVYLEDKWLMSLTNPADLWMIIRESEKLVTGNIRNINSKLTNFKLFKKPLLNEIPKETELIELKEFIITEWERLVEAADNMQNQLPIWIIASGLSLVVPDVKLKYPQLEVMLE